MQPFGWCTENIVTQDKKCKLLSPQDGYRGMSGATLGFKVTFLIWNHSFYIKKPKRLCISITEYSLGVCAVSARLYLTQNCFTGTVGLIKGSASVEKSNLVQALHARNDIHEITMRENQYSLSQRLDKTMFTVRWQFCVLLLWLMKSLWRVWHITLGWVGCQ